MTGLQKFLKGWRPNPVVETDPMNPAAASALAATLDIPKQVFAAGDVLPALWQWVYFPHWPPHRGLGNDGHPATGSFMPPLPARRRMLAGGRVPLTTEPRLGRTSGTIHTLAHTTVQQGR